MGDDDDIRTMPRIPIVILDGRGPMPKNIIAAPARQNNIPMTNEVMNIHLDLVGPFIGPSVVMFLRSGNIKIGFMVGSSYYIINLVVGFF